MRTVTASPTAGGHTAQRAVTRRRIVQAVNELLAEGHPSAISVPAVSRRSGVSVPTIYRYFPNKEELLDASAASIDEETRTAQGDDPLLLGRNFGAFMLRVWRELASNLPAVRASHLSGLGRDLRRRRRTRRHADAVATFTELGIDLDTEDGQRLLRIALVLTSSSTLLEQLDRLDLPVDQSAEDVVWAVETLAATVLRGQGGADGGVPG